MANLVTFAKKLWKDATSGGTPITAAELNRIEGGINDCANKINKLGDSVSRIKIGTVSFTGIDEKKEHVLLTRDEFVAIAGRECNGERDFIGVYSGDLKGIETYSVSASCNKEDGNVYVKFTDRNDGRGVRVTYLIVLGF